VDNVRRDKDAFMTFLVRRLPQRIPSKLILVFVSNRLDWPDQLDPRVKSFLKMNEIVFKPYDAVDLQRILGIRVDKALMPKAINPGVIEKIAAMASREHGDARKAVALLAKSAYLAEKAGQKISLDLVDTAATQFDQDRYLALVRTAPVQLQAVLAAVINLSRKNKHEPLGTGEVYDAYRTFCETAGLKIMTGRAVGDLLGELDIYSLIRSRVVSRGRYGRTREIVLDLPHGLIESIQALIRANFDLHG